jgi:very-short-patch-repair endonuclease
MKKRNVARARELRRTNTDAEALLWRYLRNRGVDGCKFTRQEPIGPCIADFACRTRKLAIELDGQHHDGQQGHDQARTETLQKLGYRVVRFSNVDVLANVEGIVAEISRLLSMMPPHPNPLPTGRGDRKDAR